jgi:hypothetical protein
MNKADDLYVMANSLLPGVYKVGRAADPHKRAQSLMASQPFRIKALVTFPEFGFLERAVHKSLEHFRVRSGPGVEWFKCPLQNIVSCVLTRLPTYFSQVVTEKSWHAVEGIEAALVADGGSSDASNLGGSSLGGDGMSAIYHVGTRAGHATDGSGSPIQVVPDGGEFPVFGEVGVGVLTVSQVAAMNSLDDLAFRQEAAAHVFEGPTDGLEVCHDFDRLSNETIGPI